MYIKFEEEGTRKYFTYFKKERKVGREKVFQTEKCVFGLLSEGIRTGEEFGKPIYEYDYWNVTFCGKALELAKELKNKARIRVTEMNVRNRNNFPSIMVTQFELLPKKEAEPEEEKYMDIPKDEELLFQ